MRSSFIAAWVTQQQRAFHLSTRGIMTPENRQALEDEAEAAMAEIERAAAEKAIKALEIELVGSMDDGTFIVPWVEIPAGEIREKIWAVFDSYGAAALGLTAEQEEERT